MDGMETPLQEAFIYTWSGAMRKQLAVLLDFDEIIEVKVSFAFNS